MANIDEFYLEKIKVYFEQDYSHKAIIALLKKEYDFSITLRSLSRVMKHNKFKRKNIEESSIEEIGNAILMELQGSAYNFGYRSMWKHLRTVYKLKVRQKVVMNILKELDPEGVEARSRYKLKRRVYEVPGPNYLWHADNHDKLKRFGFAIYGCIDGYSKKIIWIELSTSNNDPKVIAHYYLQTIKKCGFLPAIIRTDNGTEATLMEDLHKALRWKDDDANAGHKSFLRGKSTHNQRIECFWRQFRQRLCDFYINFFKVMETENLLSVSDKFDIECLRYCFGPLIQSEISFLIKEWNEHKIRKQNSRNILGGIPNELYYWPERYGTFDHKRPVKEECLESLITDYTTTPVIYSENIEEIVNLILPNISSPCTVEDAYNLYIKIRNTVQNVTRL